MSILGLEGGPVPPVWSFVCRKVIVWPRRGSLGVNEMSISAEGVPVNPGPGLTPSWVRASDHRMVPFASSLTPLRTCFPVTFWVAATATVRKFSACWRSAGMSTVCHLSTSARMAASRARASLRHCSNSMALALTGTGGISISAGLGRLTATRVGVSSRR